MKTDIGMLVNAMIYLLELIIASLTPLLILDAFGLLSFYNPWLELYLMALSALLLSLLLMDAART